MEDTLTVKLVHILRKYLPKEEALASELMKVLSLSEEVAYGKLQGDTTFSFDETAKLSSYFGFSLDKIVGESLMSNNSRSTFTDPDFSYSGVEYLERYARRLAIFTDMFRGVSKNPQGTLRIAALYLPYNLIFPYKTLTLFRHYKKAYFMQGSDSQFRFSDFTRDTRMEHMESQFLKECLAIPNHLLILNRDAFDLTIKNIGHFRQQGLISDTDFGQLQKELLDLIARMEKISVVGRLEGGSQISIYLSNVRMGAVYAHIESPDQAYSFQFPYFADILSFDDQKDPHTLKVWIDSMKGSSTLISKTGAMPRVEFFRKQREMIHAM